MSHTYSSATSSSSSTRLRRLGGSQQDTDGYTVQLSGIAKQDPSRMPFQTSEQWPRNAKRARYYQGSSAADQKDFETTFIEVKEAIAARAAGGRIPGSREYPLVQDVASSNLFLQVSQCLSSAFGRVYVVHLASVAKANVGSTPIYCVLSTALCQIRCF